MTFRNYQISDGAPNLVIKGYGHAMKAIRGVVRGGPLGPWPHLVLAGLWGTPMGHTHGPTSFWRLGPTSVKNLATRLMLAVAKCPGSGKRSHI